MNITVRGKNIEVTGALTGHAEKKLGKLSRYLPGAEAQVVLSVIRGEHIVEVTVLMNGLILRGEESTSDMYASIDLVVDKLEKQVIKHKTRLNKSLRQRGLRAISEQLTGVEQQEETGPEVVKTKRFPLKPMNLEEAILQMSLLGHDFFVFANADTETVNVLYRRKDGNFGLIDPEY